jgi:hypothetical protein
LCSCGLRERGHVKLGVLQNREPTFEVTRLAYDPRCYWLPPHKSLPSREALALRMGLRPFRQVADTWPLGPADNQPNPCGAFLNLFDRAREGNNGLPGNERHQQSPANQRHKVRGLVIPLTRNFCIESHFSPASAGLFERGFISKGTRNTRRQKFSSVVRVRKERIMRTVPRDRGTSLAAITADFCNSIGTSRTSADVRLESAKRSKADVEQTSHNRSARSAEWRLAPSRCASLSSPRFPRVIETMASLCRVFFSISGDVRGISSASLWSRIFNIRLLIPESRFELV